MAKLANLLVIVLLICSTLTYAARPTPAHIPTPTTTSNTQFEAVEVEQGAVAEENCEGAGEEECLLRRTLAAHIDYIYTQKQKH